jgi:hypothetical protein
MGHSYMIRNEQQICYSNEGYNLLEFKESPADQYYKHRKHGTALLLTHETSVIKINAPVCGAPQVSLGSKHMRDLIIILVPVPENKTSYVRMEVDFTNFRLTYGTTNLSPTIAMSTVPNEHELRASCRYRCHTRPTRMTNNTNYCTLKITVSDSTIDHDVRMDYTINIYLDEQDSRYCVKSHIPQNEYVLEINTRYNYDIRLKQPVKQEGTNDNGYQTVSNE